MGGGGEKKVVSISDYIIGEESSPNQCRHCITMESVLKSTFRNRKNSGNHATPCEPGDREGFGAHNYSISIGKRNAS